MEFGMGPLAVPDGFLGANACVIHRPRRNKPACLLCHRQRKLVYSHSIVPVGLGVKSYRTRLMPGTSAVMRAVILCSTA